MMPRINLKGFAPGMGKFFPLLVEKKIAECSVRPRALLKLSSCAGAGLNRRASFPSGMDGYQLPLSRQPALNHSSLSRDRRRAATGLGVRLDHRDSSSD